MQELLVPGLGTLVTILGLVAVAPREAGRAVPALGHSVKRGADRARTSLSKLLPFLRRPGQHNPASLNASIPIVSTVSAFGRVGLTGQGSPHEQLTAIRAAIVSIHAELDWLRAESAATRAEMSGKLNRLAEDHAALREALDAQRSEQEQVNARAFPMAALGAALAGFPGPWLVAGGWWLTTLLALAGAVAACVAIRWLWEARAELCAGWHSFDRPAQQAG